MTNIIHNLEIRDSPGKGRGVFALKNFSEGDVIHTCPVIIIPDTEVEFIDKTILTHYWYEWGEKNEHAAIALGYGSLFNHSTEPNASYEVDEEKKIIVFTAYKDIKAGDEIHINYNGDEDDQTGWFENEES